MFNIVISEPDIPLDIIFALDGSASVRNRDFEKMKDFVKHSAREYDISQNGPHIGVIEFSDRADLKIKLSDHYDLDSFTMKLSDIEQSSGQNTVTDEVLRMAASTAFKSTSGGRPTAQKRLIILTASKSTGAEPVQEAVIPVISEGIQVYVVAVGSRVDRKELQNIVGPNNDRLFFITGANELGVLVRRINDKITAEASQGNVDNKLKIGCPYRISCSGWIISYQQA